MWIQKLSIYRGIKAWETHVTQQAMAERFVVHKAQSGRLEWYAEKEELGYVPNITPLQSVRDVLNKKNRKV